MNDYKLDLEKYATLARQAAAEGCVLLENEKQALPLREGESVAGGLFLAAWHFIIIKADLVPAVW